MYTLEFENVTNSYGRETVVDDLTFTLQLGRVTGFLGPKRRREGHGVEILLDLAEPERQAVPL